MEVVLLATLFEVVLGAAFRLLLACLAGTAFFAGRALSVLFLAVAFDTVALFAFCFAADFAFTARLAVLEDARLAADRVVDRRKPFERLLLIWVSSTKAAQVI